MRLSLPEDSIRTGTMMLSLNGFWSVKDFRELLSITDDVYERVASTTLFGDLVREEDRRNQALRKAERVDEMDWSWSALYFGRSEVVRSREGSLTEWVKQPEPWTAVVSAVRPFVAPLNLGAVRLESPGWINVLGHLNPLKNVSDLISKWRAENTKRMKIETDAELERDRVSLEREKMNRQFALDILSHLPEGRYGETAARFAEIAEHTINPSIAALGRLLSDSRVLNAEIVDSPSSRPSSTQEEAPMDRPRRQIRLK